MNADRRLLRIALSLPLVFTALVSAAVFIPRMLSRPPVYGFVYATDVSPYNSPYVLQVIDGTLRRVEQSCPSSCAANTKTPRIFFHDVRTQRSVELSLDEASRYRLDPSQESPDGYRIERGGYSDGGFLLPLSGGKYDQRTYLVGPAGRFKLNLATPHAFFGGHYSYEYYNAQLLGWVISEEK